MPNGELFGLIKIKIPEASIEEQTRAILIPKERLLEVARCLLNQNFDNLHCITAVDKNKDIELIYTFYSMKKRTGITLKTHVPVNDMAVESVAGVWRSADWLEREIYDLFGVRFLNHPNLKRILNPDDWDVYPLRKDFSRPDFIKKPQF